jgi:hypothetical protein
LNREIAWSRHLDPLNVVAAREQFMAGEPEPPFRYAPAGWADDAIAALEALTIPGAHALGPVLRATVAETRAWCVALRERTAEAFADLAEAAGWKPAPGLEDEPLTASERTPTPIGPHEMAMRFMAELDARGLREWRVELDPVMSARVLVDAGKRLVRVSPHARFRDRDVLGLVAHEIDTHVARAHAGSGQALAMLGIGLHGSLEAEEGLAILAEERAGTLQPSFLARARTVADAVEHARVAGFREVYSRLVPRVGSATAFGMALRIKRGLARPGEPGVYSKDLVYGAGFVAVRAWLGSGDLQLLLSGKVGLGHPLAEWERQGFLRRAPLPPTWSRAVSPPG